MNSFQMRLWLFVLTFTIPSGVWGDSTSPASRCGAAGKLCNPLKEKGSLWDLIEFIIRDILVEIIAPIVITLMLLWSGFLFIIAQGNQEKLTKARNNFFYVVLGAIILLGAYVILSIVNSTINQIVG